MSFLDCAQWGLPTWRAATDLATWSILAFHVCGLLAAGVRLARGLE